MRITVKIVSGLCLAFSIAGMAVGLSTVDHPMMIGGFFLTVIFTTVVLY